MYDVKDWALLLAHMLKTKSVLHFAATKLMPEYWSDPRINGARWQSMMFSAIVNHYTRHGQAPDRAIVEIDVRNYCVQYWPYGHPESNAVAGEVAFFFDRFLVAVGEQSAARASEAAQWMYRTCYIEPKARDLIAQADQDGDLEQLANELSELTVLSKSGNSDVSITGISTLSLADVGDRRITGLPFFDSRFGEGKGPVTGCCLGIIAPQGAGKTTLGIQFCVTQAVVLDKPSMLVLVEEGMTKTMKSNILACATGVKSSIWLAHGENLEAAIQESGADPATVRHKLANLDRNLKVIDLVNNEGSLEAVEQQIDMACDRGVAPYVTYIDWAGMLADKLLALGHRGRTFDKLEPAIKHVCAVLTKKAAERNLFIVISQQMAVDDAKRGTTARHTVYVARDCRSFTEQFKYCVTVNERNKEDMTVMQVVKARNDAKPEPWVVQLHGALARFEEAKTHRILGKSIQKTRADEHQIPKG